MSEAIKGFELWRLAATVNGYLDKTLKPLAKKYGLTPTQLRIIYFTKKPGFSTVGSIAKMAGIACTNASAMCKKLTHMGFLRRRRSAEDERIVEIELTDEGMSAAHEIEKSFSGDTLLRDELKKINDILESTLEKDKGSF